jgi:N-acetylneuraminic acid mutarotase
VNSAFQRFCCALGLAMGASLSYLPHASAEDPYAPQPQASLRQMLSIDWHKGPNLPQGFQDSSGGVVGHTLVTACGFCQGIAAWGEKGKQLEAVKPGLHPRGFLNKVWGLDLENRQNGWASLSNYPACARQGMMGAVVDDELHVWGGFNYTKPFCYKDGYKLARQGAGWQWKPLPPLPSPVTAAGYCSIGSKIYLLGGADYDEQRFYTVSDRSGANKRLGARLQVIDTKDLAAGWKLLPECPGTPRFCTGMAAVQGKIYLIGGATGDIPEGGYATVVDNWMFDPGSNRWQRLRDLPLSSGNFSSGKIVFRDRYILLMCGFQYAKVANPDGTLRAKYGTPSRFHDTGDYYNDVFVYDTRSATFGTADKLPLNNAGPLTVLRGDEVFLIGGETGGGVVEGELFGHHPNLCLVGTIRER